MPALSLNLGLGLNPNKGGGEPWRAFGGAALRVGGQILRVTSKPLVVEPNA